MATFVLYESAVGYGIFEVKQFDEIGASVATVQEAMSDLTRFGKVVEMTAFRPFTSAADSLEQINAVSEGQLTDSLKQFLLQSLPKVKEGKKAKFKLGTFEPKLGSVIQEETNIPCMSNDVVGEVLRGVRANIARFIGNITDLDIRRAQLGLAHSYSRAKVKFNVNKVDNMIIQAIALLDTLDKDINTFIMRVREWYSWHFPELVKIVNDNYQYARLALIIKDKSTLTEASMPDMTEVVGEEAKAKEVLEAARMSMGQDISAIDLLNIELFAKRVIKLAEYRHQLHAYLLDKMHTVAPNLSALIGEVVGARLISHAGSLTNLAKYPASTVQILGAEKALFRALKTKGNTPKYGLIFHSSFIGRAKQRNKGRISRYLANKCSIASRIDAFMDTATSVFGEKMKEQVEERLRFYEEGVAPRKNAAVIEEAMGLLKQSQPQPDGQGAEAGDKKKKEKKRKRAEEAGAEEAAAPPAVADVEAVPPLKKKKKKEDSEAVAASLPTEAAVAKKKKKKDSS